MVGLGDVNNTSDLNKPVSTATQTALDVKAPLTSPTFTGTVSGIDKAMVGLENVNNTSDLNKPVSTLTQTALDAKAPLASPTFTGTVSGITKAMVGLGDVNNTSDLNKPISTATQTALDVKAPLASPTFTGTVGGITKAMVGLGDVNNTTDLNKPVSTATQTALDVKAPLASPTFTGTVGGITKAMVGLGDVNNTTDLNKPVSTLTQTALNLKVNVSDTSNMLNPYLRKADAIISNAIAIIADLQNQVTLLKNMTDVLNLSTGNSVDIDGNIYQGVRIGGQIWMKENLRVSRYNNGDLIPIETDNTAWVGLTTGGRSWYDNDSTTYENPYGNLYNWYAVNDSRKLCPEGWHVPTDAEWTTLITYLGGDLVAGGVMKSTVTQPTTSGWNAPNTGATNESGFSAFPGGCRNIDGPFGSIRISAFFWSATQSNLTNAWPRDLPHFDRNVFRNSIVKSFGASVRCLRD